MYPYSAQDIVRVMRYEMTPEDERRRGPRIAEDVRRDDNGHDEDDRSDKGQPFPLRFLFVSGASFARGAENAAGKRRDRHPLGPVPSCQPNG